MNQWKSSPGGIAVLTFTNNASDVITDRVCQFSGVEKIGFPHFIGTIDSWLHGYIGNPFAHLQTGYVGRNSDRSLRILDNSSKTDFLNAFKTEYGINKTGNPSANQYYYDYESYSYVFISGSNSGSRSIDIKRSQRCLKNWEDDDLRRTKDKFLEKGFATYQDVENICLELLLGNDQLVSILSERFPLLIVEESQDLSVIQLYIFQSLKEKGTHLHFVGDLDQAIYGFKKVDPEKVQTYANEQLFKPMHLTRNFRSCQPIVDVCQQLVQSAEKIKSGIETKELAPCIFVSYPKDKISALPNWFEKYLESVSINRNKSKIVTRGWSNVSELRSTGRNDLAKSQLQLATAIHLWKTGDDQSLPEAISLLGRFIAKAYLKGYARSSRSHFCPEGVDSAMEWCLFLATIFEQCSQNGEVSNFNLTWKEWAAVIRNQLPGIIEQSRHLLKSAQAQLVSELGGDTAFSALNKKGNVQVVETLKLSPTSNSDIRITTIHDVKGETLDAVMLVSSIDKRGTNGHGEQWLENASAEAARLAFVASSRPRQLLVWAVPEVNDKDLVRLEKMGFVAQEFEHETVGNKL